MIPFDLITLTGAPQVYDEHTEEADSDANKE